MSRGWGENLLMNVIEKPNEELVRVMMVVIVEKRIERPDPLHQFLRVHYSSGAALLRAGLSRPFILARH